MTEKAKLRRARKIADELDALGFAEVAESLRNAVISKEKGNGGKAETQDDDTGGNQPPPGKDRP